MVNKQVESDFESIGLFDFLWQWRKHLLVITSIGFVGAIIASLLIQERYKSTVVMFPATTSSFSKAILSQGGSNQDILTFGVEEHAEHLLQILNSDEVREKIVKKYDLAQHYEIEPDHPYRNTLLRKQFEDHIGFNRTSFGSIEIKVLDKDPIMAADMANDIAALVDTVMNRILKERAVEALKVVREEYLELANKITHYEDSMTFLRKKGVHDYYSQVEMLNEQMAIAISKNNTNSVRSLQQRLDTLAQYGGAYVSLQDKLEHEIKLLSELEAKYEQAKVDVEAQIPHKFIVNKAYIADKKSYPVRWLIVMISTICAFIFAVIIIIALEKVQFLKQQHGG